MHEDSKYANWLLVTLLFTLLVSSLILGWLLTRSSVFVSPALLTKEPLAAPESAIASQANLYPAKPIQVPQSHTEKPDTRLKASASSTLTPSKQNLNPEVTNRLPSTLLESQDYLDQAAITPRDILPLASLAVNQPTALPKTTAPVALTVQGLVEDNTTNQPIIPRYKSAWLYAGQFQNGKWSLLGLDLDVATLPEPNKSYKLTWGAKVRSAPPGQRMSTGSANLAESIGYLAEGSSIQVLSVKQSGKNGHIWLEIAYGQ